MRDLLFGLRASAQTGLQSKLREQLVSAILGGQIPVDTRLPSSRQLATTLGISRNTVTLAYQGLIDDGFLIARERSGYYVNKNIVDSIGAPVRTASDCTIDWSSRFRVRPSHQLNISKPTNWAEFPYPFIFGQVDERLFAVTEWRDCSRRALGRQWLDSWTADHHANDDPMLVEQIRTRLLPRRGVMAANDEILITLGAQNALYLLASLLVLPKTVIGLENPGYPDVRNIFQLRAEHIQALNVDNHGLVIDDNLAHCDLVYTTPSHQAPTTVTMTERRRARLLERADADDFLIIEDDYELETNFVSAPTPALKSLDRDGRVIYVGSLSKTLFPGLRLGYVVGAPELIHEVRSLRRLMVRHPPNINQRTAALFIARGHHDGQIFRMRRAYKERWRETCSAIANYLPEIKRMHSLGGSSVWLQGPENLDANRLAREALDQGIIIEPGDIYFSDRPAPLNCFRLGFSSIESSQIKPGIERLAKLMHQQLDRRQSR